MRGNALVRYIKIALLLFPLCANAGMMSARLVVSGKLLKIKKDEVYIVNAGDTLKIPKKLLANPGDFSSSKIDKVVDGKLKPDTFFSLLKHNNLGRGTSGGGGGGK